MLAFTGCRELLDVRPSSESDCESLPEALDTGWKMRELRIVVHIVHRDILIECRRITRIDGSEVVSYEQFILLLILTPQILEENADTVDCVIHHGLL